MARAAAVATSPVVYFTDQGTHFEVPMSTIEFENGLLVTNPARGADDKLLLFLRYQAGRGHILPAPAAPTPPAFVVEAKEAGSTGNKIEISTSTKATTTPGRVDVQVSATDRYPDVKADQLAGLLGTATDPGTQPGLLQVATNPNNAVKPTPGVKPEDAGTADTWALTGTDLTNTTTAVTLEPRVGGTEFDAGTVVVRVDPGELPDTFTLTVSWTSPLVEDVDPAGFATAFTPEFDFLVDVTEPADGYKLPQLGDFTLTGGKEPAEAIKAKATVLADQ